MTILCECKRRYCRRKVTITESEFERARHRGAILTPECAAHERRGVWDRTTRYVVAHSTWSRPASQTAEPFAMVAQQ